MLEDPRQHFVSLAPALSSPHKPPTLTGSSLDFWFDYSEFQTLTHNPKNGLRAQGLKTLTRNS